MKKYFIFICMFSFLNFPLVTRGESKQLSIGDYYKILPKKYIQHTGDYDPKELKKVIDIKNGYLALKKQEQVVFSMALFKKLNKEPLIVVSNLVSDEVCSQSKIYFFKYIQNKWIENSKFALPKIKIENLFKRIQSSKDQKTLSWIKLRFKNNMIEFVLPQFGTQIKLSYMACYEELESEIEISKSKLSLKEIRSFIGKYRRTLFLKWERKVGRFLIE